METARTRFKEMGAKHCVLYSVSANTDRKALFKSIGYLSPPKPG